MENYNFDTNDDGTAKTFEQVDNDLMSMFHAIASRSVATDDFRMAAHSLYEHGHCVVSLFNTEQIEFLASVVKRSVETFHELVSDDAWNGIERGEKLVLGYSGAIGIPSVFHHPGLRFLRLLIHSRVALLFDYYVGSNEGVQPMASGNARQYYLQQICDRLCARFKRINASTTRGDKAVDWRDGFKMHRDQSYASRKKLWNSPFMAHVFGGWLALTGSQEFGCADSMHATALKTTLIADFTQEEADAANAAFRLVKVEPGQLLVFNQTIPHAMVPYKGYVPMWRLFTAFAVTSRAELIVAKDAAFARDLQSIVAIKNQERCPVYSHSFERAPDALQKWCVDTFKPQFLVEKKLSKEKTYMIAKAGAHFSLRDGGCPYASYTAYETKIYNPVRRSALGRVME